MRWSVGRCDSKTKWSMHVMILLSSMVMTLSFTRSSTYVIIQTVYPIFLIYRLYNKFSEGVKFSMSPRPYQLGQRKAASEQTRARILAAVRALLMAPDGYSRFSIETVARQADVARMTVYHQFGSKLGLLEGLLTVAKFIYLLYTIPIFFDPLTFSRLFERNRPKKEERMLSSPRLDHCLSVIERKE